MGLCRKWPCLPLCFRVAHFTRIAARLLYSAGVAVPSRLEGECTTVKESLAIAGRPSPGLKCCAGGHSVIGFGPPACDSSGDWDKAVYGLDAGRARFSGAGRFLLRGVFAMVNTALICVKRRREPVVGVRESLRWVARCVVGERLVDYFASADRAAARRETV